MNKTPTTTPTGRSEIAPTRRPGRRHGRGSESIVSLHFSPLAISKRNGAGPLEIQPDRIRELVGRICEREQAEILRSDISPAHVHLLLRIPPRRSLRSVLPRLRRALARRLESEYRAHAEDYWALHFWEWEHSGWGDAPYDEVAVQLLE